MNIWKRVSDADLQQSIDLAREAAEAARKDGKKQREADAHKDLNDQLDEAERRGWFRR